MSPGADTSVVLAPRRAPEAYVRAEIASFPLTGEMAFRSGLISLDPTLEKHDATRSLWRACESSVVEHAGGWSLDRMIAVRDHLWFTGDQGRPAARDAVPMHRYLRHLAGVHLERRSAVTEVKRGDEETDLDAITHYRWLTFSMPEDLLLAAVDADPPPSRVSIEPPLLLRRLLDLGVAELHQHVGAGMDFPILWTSALAALTDPELSAGALGGPGAPLRDGEELASFLLAAAITRATLAEYMIRGAAGETFAAFVRGQSGGQGWFPERTRTLEQALAALRDGDAGRLPAFGTMRDLYGDIHPEGRAVTRAPPGSLDEIHRRCDPVARRLALSGPNEGERWFVREGLTRLERAGGRDALFARLFWQALRVRCLYYRAVVQRPMTAGLQWFIRFYGRIGVLRRPLRAARPEISYQVAGHGDFIGALELRTSLEDTPVKLAGELRELLLSWERVLARTGGKSGGAREAELGVVLHFVKERDPARRWFEGRPAAFWRGTHAEPRPAGSGRHRGARYLESMESLARKARALAELLSAAPRLLWLVRGLDVANDEIALPTWALVPLYRFVLKRAAEAASRARARGAPPLRTTAHVGEDFRHLMEGLRRVFESVHYLLERSGSRLGHATALGLDPRLWAEACGSALMPAEDRLWDLVVEWRMMTGHRVPPELVATAPPGRTARLENRIRDLARRVFGAAQAVEPHVLAEVHDLLHRFLIPPVGPLLSEAGLGSYERALSAIHWSKVHFADEVEPILRQYLTDESLFERGQVLVDVTLDGGEVEALLAVQDALRRGVAARGLVVEVNPSSNLLIGDLVDLRHHPILRLFPPEPNDGPSPVPIVVGSDDPVTFSTSLLKEYALLHQTARAAGYCERTAQAWLDSIRQTSMDARFTLPWAPSATAMAGELRGDLDRYLLLPGAGGR